MLMLHINGEDIVLYTWFAEGDSNGIGLRGIVYQFGDLSVLRCWLRPISLRLGQLVRLYTKATKL